MGFYFAQELGRVLIAVLCLLGLFLLRKKRIKAVPLQVATTVEPTLIDQKLEGTLEVPELLLEPTLSEPRPKPEVPNLPPIHAVDPMLKLRVQSGSWYLYSLNDAPHEELCKTFEKISFGEAVAVLNKFEEKKRKDIVERMRLAPAFEKRLSELHII